MGNKIKENKLNDERSMDTLTTLFLYEQLIELENKIDMESVLIYFDSQFEFDVPERKRELLLRLIKNRLKEIRMNHFVHELSQQGYSSHEF